MTHPGGASARRAIARRASARLLVVLAALLLRAAPARPEVVARPSPIEAVCPMPPQPVRADGRSALCYELHLTNFGAAPLVLRRVEIFAPSARGGGPASVPERPLATLADTALTQSLRLVGPGDDPARIDPGRRTILFVWLPMPLAPVGATGPVALRHRLTFQLTDSTTTAGAPLHESRLDGVVVPIRGAGAAGSHAPPVLATPFRGGVWLAGNGPGNTSAHRRSVIALAGRATIAQRFAIDWLLIGANGDTWHDDVTQLGNWWGYGEHILAAADGVVTRVVDAYPDNPPHTPPPPVTVDNIAGNHVIIRFAPDRYVMCAHLKRGSVRVREGQRVRQGDWIAELGNSGNTTGPHVHFEVMDANSPMAAEGVPWRLASFHCLGFGKDYDPAHHPDVVHHLEIPADDMVVRIP